MFDVNAIADQEKEFQLMKDNLKAAGKICHEMKQPLMISMGFLDLLLMEASELERSRGKLSNIRSQIQRLSELTNILMNLIHKQAANQSNRQKFSSLTATKLVENKQ